MLEDQRRRLVELLDMLVETTIRSESGIPYCDWSRSSIEAPQTSSATLRTVEVVPEGFIGVGIEVVEEDGRLKGIRPRRCVLPSNRQGYESYGGSHRHFGIGHRAARTALARPATASGGWSNECWRGARAGQAGSCRSTETPVLARPRCWSVRSRSDSASGSSAPPGSRGRWTRLHGAPTAVFTDPRPEGAPAPIQAGIHDLMLSAPPVCGTACWPGSSAGAAHVSRHARTTERRSKWRTWKTGSRASSSRFA